MSGFGNLQPRTGNKDSVRLEEVIKMHKWPADEWSQVRFLPGKILPVKRHWIKILAGKDGTVKKEISIPRYCIAFDVNNENEPRKDAKGKEIVCPYCTLTHGNEGSARYEFFYLANAIIREVQEDMPARAKKIEKTKEEKKTGFKDIRSKSWTPVEVCRITSTVAGRIQELGDGNFAKNKKTGEKKAYDVTHEKYGLDIRVKFKPKGAGTDKYSADKDERTPLTEDEKGYLTWRLDESLVDVTGRMDAKQAVEDFKRMEVVGATEVDDDEDGYSLGDDDGKKKKKKKKSAAFEDDDEDDKPKKKKKSKSSDDDDDEPPKKKKKKKPAFSDDDDDDDEPKKTKKSSGDKKAKSKDKVKSSKKSSKSDDAPKKKKAKKDEDDAPKKKKSSDGKKSKSSDKKADKASSKKKGKKKASAWDDDDE
jgi:hypothetical protein